MGQALYLLSSRLYGRPRNLTGSCWRALWASQLVGSSVGLTYHRSGIGPAVSPTLTLPRRLYSVARIITPGAGDVKGIATPCPHRNIFFAALVGSRGMAAVIDDATSARQEPGLVHLHQGLELVAKYELCHRSTLPIDASQPTCSVICPTRLDRMVPGGHPPILLPVPVLCSPLGSTRLTGLPSVS